MPTLATAVTDTLALGEGKAGNTAVPNLWMVKSPEVPPPCRQARSCVLGGSRSQQTDSRHSPTSADVSQGELEAESTPRTKRVVGGGRKQVCVCFHGVMPTIM